MGKKGWEKKDGLISKQNTGKKLQQPIQKLEGKLPALYKQNIRKNKLKTWLTNITPGKKPTKSLDKLKRSTISRKILTSKGKNQFTQ